MLTWVSIFLLILYFSMIKAGVLSSQIAEVDAKINGLLVDYFGNMFSVKIFATHDFERKQLDKNLSVYITKARIKILFLKTFFTRQGIIFSGYIVGSLCGMIYLANHNLISAGDFALVFMLNADVMMRMFYLGATMNDFVSDWGTIGQAITVLDGKAEILDKPNAPVLRVKQAQIKFDNVHFNYPGAEPLFENKSVTIQHGSKVGLVGYSGGGKTTFVNLILRLYDVASGRVLIDNQDVRDVTQDSLREAIAMIPQDPTLFHRSLIDNIRYGRIDATDEEVFQASKQAFAHEFISKLPQGYETLVGERGVKLSGGQRQRIAIARAILKKSK
ncbi:MAG TPA: ABC transporter ATP-binding protein, partial [Gammaproteobacteria bacterium]|nr:ABC transporter ATP-binding protein [Gammaproteobacteria bacterium]